MYVLVDKKVYFMVQPERLLNRSEVARNKENEPKVGQFVRHLGDRVPRRLLGLQVGPKT